ncbi:MAG: transposase, partial [Planctomycetaceae bacterium]|nr:transposase [Planctomycetaceae bacterium]
MPLLARLNFSKLVDRAGYPGTKKVPADAALLSLLTLKLLDKERHSHIDDFNFEEALGLFAGWNVLPKKSFAGDYS